MVRIVSEIASMSLALEAIVLLQCVDGVCSTTKQAALYNIIGNCFFGLIIQTCDNYMTFQRYNVMVKGVSRLHACIAFLWYLVVLTISWLPFSSILPIWYNQNGDYWMHIESIGNYIDFAGYCAYDLFYLVQVYRILNGLRRNTPTVAPVSSSKMSLDEIGIRAILHTIVSIVGIMLYSFNLPAGVLEQNILIAGGIHFFLNWKYKYTELAGLFSTNPTSRHISVGDSRRVAPEPGKYFRPIVLNQYPRSTILAPAR